MISVILIMMAGGIGLAQVVSNPCAVTLRWLRLGGLVALSLLAVAVVLSYDTRSHASSRGMNWALICVGPFVVQLMSAQQGWARTQRLFAGLGFALSVIVVWLVLNPSVQGPDPTSWVATVTEQEGNLSLIGIAMTIPVTTGLLGGFLMTMLLGHAYLTAGGEMSQSPLHRLVWLLVLLLGIRVVLSGLFGWWPYQNTLGHGGLNSLWSTVMITARFAVGFLMPALFLYMIQDCVRRRSNQSATGILYVTTVLVVLGEGIGLTLWGDTGLAF